MTRVLIVSNSFSPKYGGWGTVACHLAKTIEGRPDAVVTRLEVDSVSRSRGGRIRVLADLWNAWAWRHFFRDQDIVVCVCEPLLPVCAYHRMIARKSRLILLGMGTYIYYPFIRGARRWILRFFANQADALFVISRFTQAKVREWYRGEIGILQLGVDPAVRATAESKREKSFLLVGEQKERKGVSFLLDAFQRLVKEHPEAILEFAGTPSPKYKQVAETLGIANQVRFLGKISDEELAKSYSKAWAHVLPSVNTDGSFEGFGLAHLEANAYGIPSIGSAGTANDEVIVDGETGFLVRQRDPDELYRKMKQLLEDEPLYQRMCAASRKHAEEMDWHKVLPPFWNEVLGDTK